VGTHDKAITVGPTIIIGRKGSLGEVNFSAAPCWPIDTTYYIDASTTNAHLRWLSYQLTKLGLTSLNRAAAVPGLNREDAYRQRMLLPPLSEQRRIAAILDKADALRAKRRAALAQLDTLTQSIFLEMFGDPIVNRKGWHRVDLVHAVNGKYGIKAGPFGSSLKKTDYTESGYRVYGQEQVLAGRFNVGNYYIGERKYQQLKACAVQAGDVLVSLVGSFGKVLVVPPGIEPGIINPRLLKISPNPRLLTSFFLANLLSLPSVQAEFERMSHGGTMGILNAGLLKQLGVILPPILLQQDFADLLTRSQNLKIAHDTSLAEFDALFASLQHRAFLGELSRFASVRRARA
jgi:type I restriction enzyme S subunit